MKKLIYALAFAMMILAVKPVTVKADSNDKIAQGIYMGDIDLSGLTVDEAKSMVNEHVEELKNKSVTLWTVGDNYVIVNASDLGLEWTNESDIDAAVSLGKKGNIVKRYKALEDLKNGNKVYDFSLAFDKELIRSVIEENCTEYDVEAINATMKIENGQIIVEDGQTGEAVNVDESVNSIYDYLVNSWDHEDTAIDLVVEVTQPKGSSEELAKLTDVLGTYTTSFSSSGTSRAANVTNGCKLVNGTLLYPGEEFSTYNTIKPFTTENGYYPAGSYLNGKVVDSIGGGICQVSTTLYNAVLLSELEVTMRYSHSMIVSYVKPSMDAAISESAGKDFKFVNNLDNPIYIDGYVSGTNITFTIYGVEYRDSSHKVTYESETLTTTPAENEQITASAAMAVGDISVESGHTGYTARLWKTVTEDGVQVSREVINNSTYMASPRSATVGIASDNPTYVARMQAAIDTGSIDTCKAEAAAIKAEIAAAAQQQADLEAYYNALAAQQAAEAAAAAGQ